MAWGRSAQLGGPLPAHELARIVLFRPYSAAPPSQSAEAHMSTGACAWSYTGLLCGFSGSHTVVLDGRAKSPPV